MEFRAVSAGNGAPKIFKMKKRGGARSPSLVNFVCFLIRVLNLPNKPLRLRQITFQDK